MLDPQILSYSPYSLTQGQKQAIDDIRQDLRSGHTMNRLLQADVGAGKSAVIFYVAMACAQQGHRSLIIVPTSILSQQHANTLKSFGWSDYQLLQAGEKNNGAAITISTHAALNDDDLLRSVSFVAIDEFVKFGVEQRAQATKYNPHLLLISATPIPRTLASTVFGDLDVSTIRELPIKRGQVITRWVLPDRREGMYEIIEQELGAGHQVYVVYPRIGDEEQEQSAVKGYGEICQRFGDQNVLLLTGRLNNETKSEALKRFKSGEVNILVSTIIAEVGLDNSNATVMVIEGADRFGLSPLHQLRGRVCRSTDTAFCFLVAETANQTSIDRLEVIERCQDGFDLAEHDLRLRGPGEIFSTKQHGLPDLKHASLVTDYDLILKAKEIVETGEISEGVKQMTQMRYDIKLGSTA